MKNANKLLACLGVTIACFTGMSQSAYAAVAGHVQFVNGSLQITNSAGQTRQAQKGDAVSEGDTVTSAPSASAQIKMQDGGFVAMRPDTKLKFDQFVFAGKQDGSEKSFFSLFKGGFRAVTGLIGQINKQNYRITTPAATIGIRGTDHETFLVVPGSPLAQIAPTGAYSKVNVGETSLTTDKGTINVLPNQMGFAGGMNQAPQVQPVNTKIFTVAEAPTPQGKADKKEEKKEEKAEAKQEEKVAKGDKEEKKDDKQADKGGEGTAGETKTETTAEGGTAGEAEQGTPVAAAPQETAAPIRETAVVDATAPSTGGAPAPAAPTVTTTTIVAEVIAPPPAPTTVLDTATVAGGTTVNITTGTATTSTGQTIPVTQGMYASQAQAAADAALLAANAAATAVTAVQTASTQVTALLPVDTAPASAAIGTASPLVASAATTYSSVSVITPVDTAPAVTAINTATTNIGTASPVVSAANGLAPVATTPADAAIATANTNIGTASPAVATVSGLAPVPTTPATTAIATADTNIATANAVVPTATALTPVNATTAIANASAAQTAADAAAAQAAAAQAALLANGAFADATAAPALAAAQAAEVTLQSANTAVQGAVTTVSTNNTSLTNAQTAAQAALTAATNNLAAANNNLNTATTQNTALTAAQLAAQSALTTANNNLATANNNLTTATTQNAALITAQAAAQAAFNAATNNLATANSNLTTATTQNATLVAAQTAAQSALNAAQANLTAANTGLTTATAQNTTIAAAQASVPTQLTAAQTAAAAAQAAAAAAQAAAAQAAALQAAGDLAGAQAQLTIAQNELTIAQQQQAAATAAQTAATTALTDAQTAQTTGLANVNNAVTAATAAQTAANTVTTQAALVAPAAAAASTALAAVAPAATTAAADAATASTQAAAAQSAVGAAGTAVTAATTAANTAATDAATAQTQAGAAQTAASTATTAVTTAATAANTAATDAGTASAQAAAAQTASTNATIALTDSTANLATVNTNAPLVATNAQVAAYNNPPVVTPNRFVGVLATVVTPAAGQYIEGYGPGAGFTGTGTANTSFVLDGAGNLVESRHTWYEETPASTATPQVVVPDANVKRTGGTAAETFKLTDNSIYGGRWTGGSITVTDNTAVVAPITRNLGTTSEHWAIMLATPTGYVQALTGITAYTKVAATSPTDALGTVGVLNSATLNANFTSQLVSAALNLTIAAKTLDVQAPNMAINGPGFSTGTQVTAVCTGCGASTYYANVGGMFAGDAAASAGLSYTLWAGAAPGATTPATDLIQGLAAFTAGTAPTLQAFDVAAQAAADAAAAAAAAATTALNTATTDNTTLAAVAQVSTAPAVTAINTATTNIGTASPAVSAANGLAPVATTPADAAIATANTNIGTASPAVATVSGLAPVATTPATTAIATADTNIATANAAVPTAAALTPVNVATATANAAAAQAAADAAAAQAAAAQAALLANGAFADATAAPALAAAQAAEVTLQSANTAVQGAVTAVNTNNTSLTNAQTAAQAALTAATSNLATANSNLTTATTQNAALTAAQAAAQAALTAATNNLATANSNLAAATTQNAALTAAQLAAQSALATAQADLTTANNNLTTATTQNAAIVTAQGSTATQLTAAQTAAAAAQAAAAAAQAAAAQAATLQAGGDLAGAQAQLVIAQQQLAIAQAEQAAATTAQAAVAAQLANAQTAQSLAGAAVTTATNVASTAATDAATASTQATNAQAALTAASTAVADATTTANTAVTDADTASTQAAAAQNAVGAAGTAVADAATAANTAATDAGTASTQAAAAQTAAANASVALAQTDPAVVSPTPSPANTVQTTAATVAANAPIAAYNNPAVAGNWRHDALADTLIAGQLNEVYISRLSGSVSQLNTNYVLDGAKNLVEIRNSTYEYWDPNGNPLFLSNADIRFTGGVAQDTYQLPDGSIYLGRWQGGGIAVTDLSATAPLAPFTDNLGVSSTHWVVGQMPQETSPGVSIVKSLVGTVNYNIGGFTKPTDKTGNIGTVTAATLTANFTAQTVSSAATLTFSAATGSALDRVFNLSNPAMSISLVGTLNEGASPTTASCSGTGCGADLWTGLLHGALTGNQGASAYMEYYMYNTPTGGTPLGNGYLDIVRSIVAFNAATTPTVPTYPAAGLWSAWAQPSVGVTGAYQRGVLNTAVPLANTNFVLDGAGNLVTALHAGYREQATWSTSPATSVYTDATITFSGGTPNDYYMLPDGSRAIGRWTGGTMTITDNNAVLSPLVNNLGTNISVPWTIGQNTPDAYIPSLIGTTTYIQRGATLPTDSFGNVGTAPTATLVANFTNMTVDASVAFTIANQGLNVTATQMPIATNAVNQGTANGFYARSENGNAPTVACTGTCLPSYTARLIGGFNGAIAASANFDYTIWPTATANSLVTDIIQGIVVFDTATAPSVVINPPAPPAGNWTAYGVYNVEVSAGQWLRARFNDNGLQPATSFVLDGAGNLVKSLHANYREQPIWRVAAVPQAAYNDATITYSGGTAYDYFTDGNVAIGRWTGGTMTISDNLLVKPTLVKTLGAASSSWSLVSPTTVAYVQSLIGTATYNMVSATSPVNSAGATGTVTSASVTANFTNQTVNADIALSIALQDLTLSATAVPMVASTSIFDALLELGTAPTVMCTGTGCSGGSGIAGSYLGRLGVQLAGPTATSAEIGYMVWPTAPVDSMVSDMIRGEIALSTTPPAVGTNPAPGSYIADFVAHAPVGGASPGYTMAWPSGNPSLTQASILLDGSGNMVRLLGTTFEEAGAPNSPPLVSIADATLTWSGGTAAEKYQTLGGDITFGRWQGGSLNVTDNSLAVASFSINLAQTGGMTGPASSLWLYGSSSTPPPVQSLVGTTIYTKTASTTPFDSLGNMGTLNSATMTANFTNQVVDAALQLTMNTLVFDVSATMPIGTFDPSGFETTPTYPATVTCGTCTFTYKSADLGGAFAGTTASDAVLGYGIALWDTLTPDVAPASKIISGYVAFNTATPPTISPTGPLLAYTATNTSVAYNGSYGGAFNFIAAPGDVTPLNNPTSFTENYGDGWGSRTDVLNGATTAITPITTANGITFGVWENVASVSVSQQFLLAPCQGGCSTPDYMYGAEGYLDSAVLAGTQTGPLVGTYTYNPVASTSFDQNSWTAGSLTTRTLSANFTNQTVSVALAGTMGVDSWTMDSANMPINFMNNANGTGSRFNGLPVVTVNTVSCAPNCGGHIDGTFVGQNYAGAIVQYGVWDNNNLSVEGLVAFSNNTPVGSGGTPTGNTVVVASTWQAQEAPSITTGAGGVLTNWGGAGWSNTVTPAAGSAAQTAVGSGSGVINWGAWAAGSTGTSSFTYMPGVAQFHWITAPEPTPAYLAEVLTTTNATYNLVGGDVTVQTGGVNNGVHGTVSSASLTANFTTQTVAVSLAATVNGRSWLASTPDALLDYSNGNTLNSFNADSNRLPSQPGYLTVTVDFDGVGTTYTPVAANGNLAGQLVGAALDGAILKFNLDGLIATPTPDYEWVQGVAALGAAVANDPATPYRMVTFSISEPMTLVPTVMVGGSYNNAARVLTDGSGNLTQFDDNSGGGSSTIKYASGGFADQGSFTVGSDTVSWGRWMPGTVDVQDRATGIWQNGIPLAGGAHALVGPLMTGPVALPVSGTYNYLQVGATTPTTDTGATGTLNAGSTYLQANFTAQTVNVGVNVTAANATLGATATNLPIQQRANFSANSMAGSLAVTCSGLCGTTNHGAIGGGFGGTGGVLAGITYGFEKGGGVNAGTVSGVVAFQRGAVVIP